ncbi:hypothetical protein F511_17929 [Dorcoceras hygrometricum]|uniref:Uncharacterized protein n=1 Tax=Dorcoceras hygrometricum TaxID=472368 RepID=A0A2Z7ARI9_9LAMI|nr:hypothetical protein F511_17929 [Dorcoceras hygrometricum]
MGSSSQMGSESTSRTDYASVSIVVFLGVLAARRLSDWIAAGAVVIKAFKWNPSSLEEGKT